MKLEGKTNTTLDFGDVTKIQADSALTELEAKIDVFGAVVEILVTKYDKHLLEYNNMHTMIKMDRRPILRELQQSKNELKIERSRLVEL